MNGVVLIVVLVITGGAIAFIGDHLGSKVGKKRISLFGLRPKHTSMLVTIITGVLITSSSIGIMAVASENVRTALFGMEKLNQEMMETKAQLATASAELQQSLSEQKSADISLNHAREGLKQLQVQMDVLDAKNKELLDGNMALEQAKGELMARNDVLSTANNDLLLSQKSLQEGNDKLLGENKDLEKRNESLREGIASMREGEIVFRAGEVLASGILKGNTGEEVAKDGLQNLIHEAQEKAYTSLMQRSGNEITEEDVQVWVYQPEYDAAVTTISKSDHDVVVRVVAVSNLLKGEGLRVSLELYRYGMAYRDGSKVLEKEIRLDGTAKKVEDEVIEFLKNVNDAAIKRGMLPDPISGAIGVIDGNQVFNTMKQLEGAVGKVTLSAVANGDVDILGPLRISLKVNN